MVKALTRVQPGSQRQASATIALLEELAQQQACSLVVNARPRKQANTITERYVSRAPTKTKRAKPLANLAELESTARERQATRCTLPKQTAAPTAPLASTPVLKASHQKADATIALPEEPVPQRAWTPARNARRRQ